ncbi:hypothetical protein ABZV14_36500 [Streptosporangium canum]
MPEPDACAMVEASSADERWAAMLAVELELRQAPSRKPPRTPR